MRDENLYFQLTFVNLEKNKYSVTCIYTVDFHIMSKVIYDFINKLEDLFFVQHFFWGEIFKEFLKRKEIVNY